MTPKALASAFLALSCLLLGVFDFLPESAEARVTTHEISRWSLAGHDGLGNLAVDAQDQVYVSLGPTAYKYTGEGSLLLARKVPAPLWFDTEAGHIAASPNGGFYFIAYNRVYYVAADGHVAWTLEQRSNSLAFWGFGTPIATNGAGHFFLADTRGIREFDADGGDVKNLPLTLDTRVFALTLGEDDTAYLTISGAVLAVSPAGSIVWKYSPPSFSPSGVSLDADGNIYVTDRAGGELHVLTPDGTPYGTPAKVISAESVAVLADGRIVTVTAAGTVVVYAAPDLDFEVDPGQTMSVVLHVSTKADADCASAPRTAEEVVTVANNGGDGDYIVYVLGSPAGRGIAGFQLGIQYDAAGTDQPSVASWHACSDLEFPQENWPESGFGNTMTFVKNRCLYSNNLVVAGYFVVEAPAPSVFGVVGYPVTGLVKTANCDGAEGSMTEVVDPVRLGWLSLAGGRQGADADGCNPLLEPCAAGVPTRPMTWSGIKNRFQEPD